MDELGLWNDPVWSEVFRAVEAMDSDVLTRLLESHKVSLDVNGYGYQGWTLLNAAIDVEVTVHQEFGLLGFPEATVSAVLLSFGADPTKKHPEGWSAIDQARRQTHPKFLSLIEGFSPS